MPTAQEKYDAVAKKADGIEAELKRLGCWSATEPSPEALENMGAFGQNTMSLEMWIQFILLPNVRETVVEKREFPDESMVGAYAIREWDGNHERDSLITMLCEFDEMIEK